MMKFCTPGHSAIQEVDNLISQIEKRQKLVEYYSPVSLLRILVFKSRLNLLPDYLSGVLVIHESLRPVRSSLHDTYDIPRVRTEMAKHSFY